MRALVFVCVAIILAVAKAAGHEEKDAGKKAIHVGEEDAQYSKPPIQKSGPSFTSPSQRDPAAEGEKRWSDSAMPKNAATQKTGSWSHNLNQHWFFVAEDGAPQSSQNSLSGHGNNIGTDPFSSFPPELTKIHRDTPAMQEVFHSHLSEHQHEGNAQSKPGRSMTANSKSSPSVASLGKRNRFHNLAHDSGVNLSAKRPAINSAHQLPEFGHWGDSPQANGQKRPRDLVSVLPSFLRNSRFILPSPFQDLDSGQDETQSRQEPKIPAPTFMNMQQPWSPTNHVSYQPSPKHMQSPEKIEGHGALAPSRWFQMPSQDWESKRSTRQAPLESYSNIGIYRHLEKALASADEAKVVRLLQSPAIDTSSQVFRETLGAVVGKGLKPTVWGSKMIRVLVNNGAGPQFDDDSSPPLIHKAASIGDVCVLKSLLGSGENVDKIYDGKTPLYRTIEEGHPQAALLLVMHGANMKRKWTEDLGSEPITLEDYARSRQGWNLARMAFTAFKETFRENNIPDCQNFG